jgi:uncharacterized protein (TIGR02391 family)
MSAIPKLDENILQEICKLIGDTDSGLSGSEIGRLLSQCGIDDLEPTITKRVRLSEALKGQQSKDGCSNNVFAFIQRVMDPIRYTTYPDLFRQRRDSLNIILAFRGYEVGNDGKVRIVEKVDNLDEASRKANKLAAELNTRKVHPQALRYCNSELLQDNYFHAVFEEVKGVADRIREITGLFEDGSELVDKAFNVENPFLTLNSLRTDTEKSEQRGFINLLKGTFGMFRNTTSHTPKIKWPIYEEEALDLLTLVSLIHKKLDKVTIIKKQSQ